MSYITSLKKEKKQGFENRVLNQQQKEHFFVVLYDTKLFLSTICCFCERENFRHRTNEKKMEEKRRKENIPNNIIYQFDPRENYSCELEEIRKINGEFQDP